MAGLDANTLLLAHFNGDDGSTADYTAETGQTISLEGTAQLDTAQKVFGTASFLLDGNSDYGTVPNSTNWNFGTYATIDCRIRLASLPSSGGSVTICSRGSDTSNLWSFRVSNVSGSYYLRFNQSGTIIDTLQSYAFSTNTWYHVAWVKNGNDHLLFVNGNQIGSTVTDADAITEFTTVLNIGKYQDASRWFPGWIEEFRVSNIARWTSNFTPPTEAYSADATVPKLRCLMGVGQ